MSRENSFVCSSSHIRKMKFNLLVVVASEAQPKHFDDNDIKSASFISHQEDYNQVHRTTSIVFEQVMFVVMDTYQVI